MVFRPFEQSKSTCRKKNELDQAMTISGQVPLLTHKELSTTPHTHKELTLMETRSPAMPSIARTKGSTDMTNF